MIQEMNGSQEIEAAASPPQGGSKLDDPVFVDTYEARRHMEHDNFWMTIASYALVLWLFLAQFAVVWWKKNRPSQYHAWSLVGLWIFPPAIGIFLKNWRFVIFCILFSLQAGYVFHLTRRRPMNADDPQLIYRIFLVGHRLTIALASLGAVLFVLTVFVLIPFFHQPFSWLLKDSVLFMFYGGYFGVMQRDFSQVVGDYVSKVVTSQIVVTRHGQGKTIRANACGLCGRELRETESVELGSKEGSPSGRWERKLMKLKECGHEFHDECIRGWSVLGKRNVCPTCNERCDTASILASTPWAKSSESWQEFLDLIRMAFVWNPIIFVVAIFVFKVLGVGTQEGI